MKGKKGAVKMTNFDFWLMDAQYIMENDSDNIKMLIGEDNYNMAEQKVLDVYLCREDSEYYIELHRWFDVNVDKKGL